MPNTLLMAMILLLIAMGLFFFVRNGNGLLCSAVLFCITLVYGGFHTTGLARIILFSISVPAILLTGISIIYSFFMAIPFDVVRNPNHRHERMQDLIRKEKLAVILSLLNQKTQAPHFSLLYGQGLYEKLESLHRQDAEDIASSKYGILVEMPDKRNAFLLATAEPTANELPLLTKMQQQGQPQYISILVTVVKLNGIFNMMEKAEIYKAVSGALLQGGAGYVYQFASEEESRALSAAGMLETESGLENMEENLFVTINPSLLIRHDRHFGKTK